MFYFVLPKFKLFSLSSLKLKKFLKLNGFANIFGFRVGDVFTISFRRKGLIYFFEGLCIRLKKKNFVDPNTSFVIRNVLGEVSVEISASYFYNRLFYIRNNKYKRKKLSYLRSKLYYLRSKLNQSSRIF